MKIGTLTFHGAYNHGSVLQTYALQEFVKSIGKEKNVDIDYSVINYRTRLQKELYWQVNPPFTKTNAIKALMRLPYRRKLKKQAENFEDFLRKHIKLTDEVDDETIKKYANSFDCFISGSDQIFNIRSQDFSFAYLQDFTDSENKISYAASLGPLQIDWSKYDKDAYLKHLSKFKYLSLRELRSKQMADELLGTDNSSIHIDPTLLLSAEQWRKVESDYNYNNGKYILFYCLEPTKQHIAIAKALSKQTGLPIVYTGYRCKYDYFNPFVKLYDAGPADFLSLIDNAEMILTSSFHGTAFSVIYDKKFIVIDGMKDNRISNLINLTGLDGNSINLNDDFDISKISIKTSTETKAYEVLGKERKRSADYLIKALEV